MPTHRVSIRAVARQRFVGNVDVNIVMESAKTRHAWPRRRTEIGRPRVQPGGGGTVFGKSEKILQTTGPGNALPQDVVAVFACKERKERSLIAENINAYRNTVFV